MSYDLINLDNLVLTDTFNTLYNRVNQVIDSLNPLQVYDVSSGATGGLTAYVNTSSGVIRLSVNSGPGIGVFSYGGEYRTVVDFSLFDTYNLAATGGTDGFYVNSNDEFMFNSVYDTSSGARPAGTVKKVKASKMLPPVIDIPSISFTGDVTVGGNLTILGNNTFVSSNNLRIQDKLIEIAYQENITLSLTGVTGTSFVQGVTGYHFSDTSSLTADLYGWIQSYTGAAAGPTGTLVLGYPFGSGEQASDFFGLTGYLSESSTGSVRYLITDPIGTASNAFLDDETLSSAGIRAYGASGNKDLLWIYRDADSGQIVDAWTVNSNFGVIGNENSIISRYFRSYGYTGISQSQFIFVGENGDTEIYLAQNDSDPSVLSLTGNTWKITRKQSTPDLVFSYGISGVDSDTELFRIAAGASGTTYPGITTSNFASQFNADMLDGAHAYRTSTPYSIPVSDGYGRIDGDWLSSSALSRNYTVVGHGFTAGNVLRITTTGAFTLSYANDETNAEALGIVESISGNDFRLIYKGKITGLSGGAMTVEGNPFVTGSVYFLAGATSDAGKLIADPDNGSYRLEVGQIRKPMMLAISETEGFVLNYVGAKLPNPTDEIYLSGLVPVGALYPYAGDLDNLSSEWLLCDGDRYIASDYSALFTAIGRTYSTTVEFASDGLTGTILNGTRNLQVGDTVSIGDYTRTIVDVIEEDETITFSSSVTGGTYVFNVLTDASNNSLFMVPDLRSRTVIGGNTGDSRYTYGNFTDYSAGDFGGNETITLTASNLPPHAHGLGVDYTYPGAGIEVVTGSGTDVTTGYTGSADAVNIRNPYLVTHWIIRAKATTLATVLTGHDHDNRYVRYDDTQTGLVLADRNRFRANGSVAGIALGSLTDGDYHDHDLRHLRIDATGQGLDLTSQYYGRINLNSSPVAEGDGYGAYGSGQTQHNHDNIYVRFDTASQAVFGANEKAFFLSKIGAIPSAGGTVSGPLTISGPIYFSPTEGIISGLTLPQSSSHAANKYYVDRYCVTTTTIPASGSALLSSVAISTPSNFPYGNLPSRIVLNFKQWNGVSSGNINSGDVTFDLRTGTDTMSIPMSGSYLIATLTVDPFGAILDVTATSTISGTTIVRTTWYE